MHRGDDDRRRGVIDQAPQQCQPLGKQLRADGSLSRQDFHRRQLRRLDTKRLQLVDSLIRFVEDRTGHDQRYSLDSQKIRALGWSPRHDFTATIEQTVAWYREHREWWEKVKSGQYRAYYQRMYGRRLAEAKPYEG